MKETKAIWKVRVVKPYPEAHNHLFIGEMVTRDGVAIELLCRTFHFARSVASVKEITVGPLGRRIVPWTRVEVINVLPADFDFKESELVMGPKGEIGLSDRRYFVAVAHRGGGRF
ncbi:MAG: hypothetical protein V2A58_02635 [Planctomycetota bacterium]